MCVFVCVCIHSTGARHELAAADLTRLLNTLIYTYVYMHVYMCVCVCVCVCIQQAHTTSSLLLTSLDYSIY